MPIYMKYGTVRGGVTERAHRSWIELESAQYGTSRGSFGFGSSGLHGTAQVLEIVVTKLVDVASNALFQECIQGEGALAFIDFVNGGPVLYRLKLQGTMISSYNYSGYGEAAVESLTLNFTKMDLIQTPGGPAR